MIARSVLPGQHSCQRLSSPTQGSETDSVSQAQQTAASTEAFQMSSTGKGQQSPVASFCAPDEGTGNDCRQGPSHRIARSWTGRAGQAGREDDEASTQRHFTLQRQGNNNDFPLSSSPNFCFTRRLSAVTNSTTRAPEQRFQASSCEHRRQSSDTLSPSDPDRSSAFTARVSQLLLEAASVAHPAS